MSEITENKKVHFVSLGCPKNLVDTEIMLGSLSRQNYSVTENPGEADTIIVNTCGFIDESKRESISTVLEMGELKKNGLLKNLVVAGCLTQRYKDELVEGIPEADLFVGSGEFQNIAEILKNREAGSTEKRYFNLPTFLQNEATPRINSQMPHRAYLKISEGCKKRCAFCAIPLIRGNLQSRTIPAIVAEAKLLVASGVREVIVISHDFTDFGWDLRRQNPEAIETPYELLKALSEIPGLDWIRTLYVYPDGIDQKLIDLIKSKDNLVKYFDMPLQHISDSILKSMNRKMTRQLIEAALKMIREEIPEAVIRTQFIVGFPGETEENFQELLGFIKEQEFDRVGCFKYSPEEKTPGSRMPDQVDEQTKQRRHDELMEVQQEISRRKHAALVGKTVEVLVEGLSEETELLLQGRTSQQAPEIDGIVYLRDGHAEMGEIVRVKIVESMDYDLVAEIIEREPRRSPLTSNGRAR
ncbi:MAG: 30S ribosomal protein S12 methylthiotransferase RimO [Bdellovibrionales bacterium CG10_big_fil_rev_8_21_14_0_10_45_34]|nr:MAG: 30S ribosomal protein S12 methylthiotransferase RimO [Bdellovibrionales bacterium CG10_big_fil_rev_8_21_14_0_10_45_34]